MGAQCSAEDVNVARCSSEAAQLPWCQEGDGPLEAMFADDASEHIEYIVQTARRQALRDGQLPGLSLEEARALASARRRTAQFKTPEEALYELQRGNMRFWSGHSSCPEESAFDLRGVIAMQWPSVAILGCSDSRVPLEIIFDLGLGDAFVVRVAGNCVGTTTLASLQYAVNHLQVKVVVVLGHEGCGAVKATKGLSRHEIQEKPEELGTLLSHLKDGLNHEHVGALIDERSQDRVAVITNVRNQLEKLAKDDSIMQRIGDGELLCVGAVYQISSGVVDFVSELANSPVSYGVTSLSQSCRAGAL
eukprot:TRINITY_DN15182_c0_g1_i2.p1 TRINITY_DN15182_c0_g1~~TRINITY_DN15182_c0_g1_i2.p1  ORF type:complete len:305 (-),score=44.97 TRINITY_DN15182_c0_g1_i2:457-1371(-)